MTASLGSMVGEDASPRAAAGPASSSGASWVCGPQAPALAHALGPVCWAVLAASRGRRGLPAVSVVTSFAAWLPFDLAWDPCFRRMCKASRHARRPGASCGFALLPRLGSSEGARGRFRCPSTLNTEASSHPHLLCARGASEGSTSCPRALPVPARPRPRACHTPAVADGPPVPPSPREPLRRAPRAPARSPCRQSCCIFRCLPRGFWLNHAPRPQLSGHTCSPPALLGWFLSLCREQQTLGNSVRGQRGGPRAPALGRVPAGRDTCVLSCDRTIHLFY